MLLAEIGYPQFDRDEVYKEVFEQAENFMRNKGREHISAIGLFYGGIRS